MTEQQWLEWNDPERMFVFLCEKPNDRKFRLFACSCVRANVLVLSDRRFDQAIEVAELMADGVATESGVAEARAAIGGLALSEAVNAWCSYVAAAAAAALLEPIAVDGARMSLDHMVLYELEVFSHFDNRRSASLIREIFGNPFRPAALDTAWLSWNGGAVAALAQAAYNERQMPGGHLDPTRLAILTDALEDVGCNDPDILAHLTVCARSRSGGV